MEFNLNAVKAALKEKAEIESDTNSEEIKAEKEFKDGISGFIGHRKYEIIKKYVEIVLNSQKFNGLVIEGAFGTGKSTLIKAVIKEKNRDFLYLNSYSTPLAFFKEVYKNRKNIIILDDLEGIFKDRRGKSILRALLNNEKNRYIVYESTTERLDVPKKFIFEGKIILLHNRIIDYLDENILSRVFVRKLDFSVGEMLELSEQVICFNYNELKKEEISGIADFIKAHADESTKDFSFRTILKITELYKNEPDWRTLALDELEKDEELRIILDVMNKYSDVKLQVNEYMALTGHSRRTFFRKKKSLVSK